MHPGHIADPRTAHIRRLDSPAFSSVRDCDLHFWHRPATSMQWTGSRGPPPPVKWAVDGWMRCFTWMVVLGLLGPPDIPQATLLPVAGKTLSQCSPRHRHFPRVQGPRRTSQSGACASAVLRRPPPHNPVTTPSRISPSSPQEGVLTERYTNQVQASTSNKTVECIQIHELESPW